MASNSGTTDSTDQEAIHEARSQFMWQIKDASQDFARSWIKMYVSRKRAKSGLNAKMNEFISGVSDRSKAYMKDMKQLFDEYIGKDELGDPEEYDEEEFEKEDTVSTAGLSEQDREETEDENEESFPATKRAKINIEEDDRTKKASSVRSQRKVQVSSRRDLKSYSLNEEEGVEEEEENGTIHLEIHPRSNSETLSVQVDGQSEASRQHQIADDAIKEELHETHLSVTIDSEAHQPGVDATPSQCDENTTAEAGDFKEEIKEEPVETQTVVTEAQEETYMEVTDDAGVSYLITSSQANSLSGAGEGQKMHRMEYREEDGQTVVYITMPDASNENTLNVNESEDGVTAVEYIDASSIEAQLANIQADPNQPVYAVIDGLQYQTLPEELKTVVDASQDGVKAKKERESNSILDKLDLTDKLIQNDENEEDDEDYPEFEEFGERVEKIGDLEFVVDPKDKRALTTRSNTTVYDCNICDDVLGSLIALTKHKNNKHPDNADYSCSVCFALCLSITKLNDHYSEAHTEINADTKTRAFMCPICQEPYKVHDHFQEHLEWCDYNPLNYGYKKPAPVREQGRSRACPTDYALPFKCKFCKRAFRSKGHVTHHISAVHLKYKAGASNSCDACERRFLDSFSYTCHLKSARHKKRYYEKHGHDETETTADRHGAHGFTNLARAPVPYQVRKGKYLDKTRPFICELCGKEFNRNSSYWIHRRTHDKPYECNMCSYRCATKPKLVVHQRIHTGELPYECAQCGKRFRSLDHVQHHAKAMHTDLVHKCTDCGNIFKHARNLDMHIRKKHGEEALKALREARARGELIVYEAGNEPYFRNTAQTM